MAQAGALVSTRAIQAGTTVLWEAKLECRNRPAYIQQAGKNWLGIDEPVRVESVAT